VHIMEEGMSVIEEILYVQPTFVGIAGALVIHVLLWTWVGNWEFGGMKRVLDVMKSTAAYHTTLKENFASDANTELFGLIDDPSAVWVWNFSTFVHHAWGGTLMGLGILLGGATPLGGALWRHGMLTEVGGLDTADLVRAVQCKLSPPGPFPMHKSIQKPLMVLLLCFHHSVGFTVGIPVVLYFSEEPRFQMFGLVILGGPSLVMLPGLVANFWSAKKHPLLHVSQMGITAALFTHQRAWFYYPEAYALVQIAMSSEKTSSFVQYSFAYGAIALGIFNLLAVVILWGGLVQFVMAKTPEQQARLQRTQSAGAMGGSAHGIAALGQLASQGSLSIFAVTQTHKWLERTRDSARKRSNKKKK